MNIRKMLTLLVGSVGARIGGAFIGLATQIVVARLLDPRDVGILFLTMSMAALLSLGVISGYPTLVMNEYPRLKFQGRNRAIAAMHASALWDWTIITIVMCFSAVPILLFAPMDDGMKLAIVFGVLSTPGSALIRYSSAIANSLKLFKATFLPDNILRPGAFLLFVLASFSLGFRPGIIAILTAYVLCNLLASLVQLPFLRGQHLRLRHMKSWRKDFSRVLWGRAAAIAIVAAVATSLADILTLLGGFFLKAEDLALLGVAVRLAAIAGFVIQSAQQFVLPDLAVTLAQKDEASSSGILRKLNIMTFAIIAVGLAFTVLFGGYVLRIFGESYASGYQLLILLMIAQSVRAMSGMNQTLLAIGGFQVRTVWACVLSVAFLVIAWLVLQPKFGLNGIGLAAIATEILWALQLGFLAKRLLGRRGDILWLFSTKPAPKTS